MPAVIDDAIMADNGDLDAMATENLGRQDLSDLAEADLFARYSEIGLTQRAIADRLGVDQATVSRRLALLLLAPEVRQAVADGELPSAEAAALSGKLPYGPLRRWQKSKDPDQDTDQRRAEQIEAQRLVLQHNWSASRAAERIVAERDARAEAAALGITLIEDPRAELGEHYTDHRISRDDYTPDADVVGAINPSTGYLDLYTRSTAASHPSGDSPRRDVEDAPDTTASGRGPSAGAQSPATDDANESAATTQTTRRPPSPSRSGPRSPPPQLPRAIAGKRAQRSSLCNPPMPNCSRSWCCSTCPASRHAARHQLSPPCSGTGTPAPRAAAKRPATPRRGTAPSRPRNCTRPN